MSLPLVEVGFWRDARAGDDDPRPDPRSLHDPAWWGRMARQHMDRHHAARCAAQLADEMSRTAASASDGRRCEQCRLNIASTLRVDDGGKRSPPVDGETAAAAGAATVGGLLLRVLVARYTRCGFLEAAERVPTAINCEAQY